VSAEPVPVLRSWGHGPCWGTGQWYPGKRPGVHRLTYGQWQIVSGRQEYGVVCTVCDKGRRAMGRKRFQAMGIDPDALPRFDSPWSMPYCQKCGQPGAERHHWAPQALFDDADQWPMDYLCRACHTRWHQVTRTNRKHDPEPAA
jgi:hypothetical protein